MDKSYEIMLELNKVEGFDPSQYAYKLADLTTGQTWSRLPVSIQIIWFRLKYPDGKIALESLESTGDGYTASVKVYMDKKDDPDQYLSNATATRFPVADKPEISPMEWAQTAAIGIALRNAGFGLPFDVVGENLGDLAPTTNPAADQKSVTEQQVSDAEKQDEGQDTAPADKAAESDTSAPMSLEVAYNVRCPIRKYADKTLIEVLGMDATAIKWVAEKSSDERARIAAQLICQEAKSA